MTIVRGVLRPVAPGAWRLRSRQHGNGILSFGSKTALGQGACEAGTESVYQPLLSMKYGVSMTIISQSVVEPKSPRGRGSQWQLPSVKRRNLRGCQFTCMILRLQVLVLLYIVLYTHTLIIILYTFAEHPPNALRFVPHSKISIYHFR